MLAMAILLCMREAHNTLMCSFENDKLHSLWFVTLIKVKTHYCPALSSTHTHTSYSLSLLLSFSLTHKQRERVRERETHILIPLHGPLGFVVAKSLNKLRNDWNWKMSNGDSSAVPSQYGDDEIWFFEVRYIIRAERLPRLWLKQIGGHSLIYTVRATWHNQSLLTLNQCYIYQHHYSTITTIHRHLNKLKFCMETTWWECLKGLAFSPFTYVWLNQHRRIKRGQRSFPPIYSFCCCLHIMVIYSSSL